MRPAKERNVIPWTSGAITASGTIHTPSGCSSNAPAAISNIEEALGFIPSDNRDIWIRCGMALKAELGEAGFDAWDRWSSTGDTYNPREAETSWRSFKPSGGVGIGTLFHIARQYGYRGNVSATLAPADMAGRESGCKADAKLLASRRQAAAAKAVSIWNDSESASASHPYLKRKGIQANGAKLYRGNLIIGGISCNGALIIPMSLNGRITSLQFINENGEKRFLPNGEKGTYLIGKIEHGNSICVCEGFATGCSINNTTRNAVMVAFDAGNLHKTADTLRAKRPDASIILCADNDTSGIGQLKATEAAQTINGRIAIPEFGASRPYWASDFNDMVRLVGKAAVKRVISLAKEVDGRTRPKLTAAPRRKNEGTVEVLRASHLIPQMISWVWNGWLAAGKVHILGGAPGTGKTTIAIALTSTVTTGGHWPDGARSPIGNVVIWSGEDDPADTLVPRLELAGADRSRVYFVNGLREENMKRSFDPAGDIEPLQRKLAEIGEVKLLIIDPIVSAIVGDSHKNAEVRRGLQPLADLAASTGCALLGITHFSKGTGGRDPVERITGSLAFGAVARVVMVAARKQEKTEDDRSKSLFLRAKSNIGPDNGGFEYELQQDRLKNNPEIYASAVRWGEPVVGAARDLLGAADVDCGGNAGKALTYAKGFLRGLLCRGPVPRNDIDMYAAEAKCSNATIRRAQEELHVQVNKKGGNFGGCTQHWEWELPPAEDAQDVPK